MCYIYRTGTSDIIFGYNGRDGVVTDDNGLIYMRARYYSPDMRRFINADIIAGKISNAVTLNRYAYANGNPVSNVDPFGLSPERGKNDSWLEKVKTWAKDKIADFGDFISNTFDSIENALKSIADLCEDVHCIIIKNVDGSAGICIGMGFSKEFGGFGAEAISRADIIGIQLKDGKLRVGHPGRSALNISLPTSVPNVNVTLGPQSNSYENIDMDYTEDSDDVTYVDVGFSLGGAAAFVIGYHYDFSISLSGIINDLLEYFQ